MASRHLPRQQGLFQELTGFACFLLLSTLELLQQKQSALGSTQQTTYPARKDYGILPVYTVMANSQPCDSFY